MTQGFFDIVPVQIGQKSFDLVLATRRSCRRAGTRYNVRGIDSNGSVANFAETEQIVYFDGNYASFVQIRGSIPLFWTQTVDISYKPKPRVVPEANHLAAAQRHFRELVSYYGPLVLVNLVDQKGSEKALGDLYESTVRQLGMSELRCGLAAVAPATGAPADACPVGAQLRCL